jgi:hypothetical protein
MAALAELPLLEKATWAIYFPAEMAEQFPMVLAVAVAEQVAPVARVKMAVAPRLAAVAVVAELVARAALSEILQALITEQMVAQVLQAPQAAE